MVGEDDASLMREYKRGILFFGKSSPSRRGKELSPHTLSKRLRYAKRFYEWLYRNEVINQIPRVLDKTYARIQLPPPAPKFISPEKVRTIFSESSQRTKLYILLALNCGYRQIDIATLEHSMIDWDAGVIDRVRNKTKNTSRTPQKHKLWDITLHLLREESSSDPKYVLLSQSGTRLVRESMDSADAGLSHTDVISQAFNRVRRKLGMEKELTFKMLRNTGANEIEKLDDGRSDLAGYYLAHSMRKTKDHYVARNFDHLFDALEKLEDIYRLDELMQTLAVS